MDAASCREGAVTPQPARVAAQKRAKGVRISVETPLRRISLTRISCPSRKKPFRSEYGA
jgi:hypothetical protein